MIWLLFDLSWASLVIDSKESACNSGDLSFIPGLGRSPGKENGYPFQWSCLDNTLDRRATIDGSQRVRRNWETYTFTRPQLKSQEKYKVCLLPNAMRLWTQTHRHTHTSKQRSINDIHNSHLEFKFSVTVMLTHHIFLYTVEKTRGHTRWHAFLTLVILILCWLNYRCNILTSWCSFFRWKLQREVWRGNRRKKKVAWFQICSVSS